MPIAAAPVVLTAAVVAAVAFLNKQEKAAERKIVEPPPVPARPPPPPPPPPDIAPIPGELRGPGGFPDGALIGTINASGVQLRSEPNERSRSLGSLGRGTLVQLFEGGHSDPTPAAPEGWERARTVNGINGFVAAQFLSAPKGGGGPRETPAIEPSPIPRPGVERIPGVPGETTAEGPSGPLVAPVTVFPGEEAEGTVPVVLLTPEERALAERLAGVFTSGDPRAYQASRYGYRFAPRYGWDYARGRRSRRGRLIAARLVRPATQLVATSGVSPEMMMRAHRDAALARISAAQHAQRFGYQRRSPLR